MLSNNEQGKNCCIFPESFFLQILSKPRRPLVSNYLHCLVQCHSTQPSWLLPHWEVRKGDGRGLQPLYPHTPTPSPLSILLCILTRMFPEAWRRVEACFAPAPRFNPDQLFAHRQQIIFFSRWKIFLNSLLVLSKVSFCSGGRGGLAQCSDLNTSANKQTNLTEDIIITIHPNMSLSPQTLW